MVPVNAPSAVAADADALRLREYLARLGLPPERAAAWAEELVTRARGGESGSAEGRSAVLAAIDEVEAWTESLAAASGAPLALLLLRLRELLAEDPGGFLQPAAAWTVPREPAEAPPEALAPPPDPIPVRVEPLQSSRRVVTLRTEAREPARGPHRKRLTP